MKKAMIAIRLDESDMAIVEEVSDWTGYTQSDAIRLLIRLGYAALSNQTGTPSLHGVMQKRRQILPPGEEA